MVGEGDAVAKVLGLPGAVLKQLMGGLVVCNYNKGIFGMEFWVPHIWRCVDTTRELHI